MNQSTIQTFLNLTPSLVSTIQAIEQAIPAPKSGPSKLKTFTDITLGLFALGAPIASAGLQLPHDPTTITQLSTLFANSIIAGINSSRPDRATNNSSGQIFPVANDLLVNQSKNLGSASSIQQGVGISVLNSTDRLNSSQVDRLTGGVKVIPEFNPSLPR